MIGTPAFRKLCDEHGALLIIDDVRAGFRLHMGGSVEYFNGKADLICYSKALGNCYPISACTGRQAYMSAASKVFLTGSFWGSAVSMAAALAALTVMEEEGSIEKMLHIGTLLQNGLKEVGEANGLKLKITGPPSIPFVSFEDETDFRRNQLFCAEVTKRGAFFHPHHNWFISSAHTEEDVKQTLEMANEAMKDSKKNSLVDLFWPGKVNCTFDSFHHGHTRGKRGQKGKNLRRRYALFTAWTTGSRHQGIHAYPRRRSFR